MLQQFRMKVVRLLSRFVGAGREKAGSLSCEEGRSGTNGELALTRKNHRQRGIRDTEWSAR